MRIKKKTSMLLLATTAAAAVGVAAVSFAAWSGSTTLSASASTGTAYLEGFTNDEELTFGGMKLVPWDQSENSYDSATCAKVISGSLTYVVVEDYTISVELKSNLALNATYYVLIDENESATFTMDGGAAPSGWTAFAGETAPAAVVYSGVGETADGTTVQKYVHIAMASDDSASDMTDKEFSFEIVYHSDTFGN